MTRANTRFIDSQRQRKTKAGVDALIKALDLLKHQYDAKPAIAQFLNDEQALIQADRESFTFDNMEKQLAARSALLQQRAKRISGILRADLKTLSKQLKPLAKVKTIDKLIALQCRDAMMNDDFRDTGFNAEDIEIPNYISLVLDSINARPDKLGLFYHTDDAHPLNEAPWFKKLSAIEQAYFTDLVKKAKEVADTLGEGQEANSAWLNNLTSEHKKALFHAVYPFPAGYTKSPVIANTGINSTTFVDDQRIGLPDHGKVGSKEEQERIVKGIVEQYMLLNRRQIEANHLAFFERLQPRQADGSLSDEASAAAHLAAAGEPIIINTESLISDLPAFTGQPSDTLYQQAIEDYCTRADNNMISTFTRYPVSVSREYESVFARQIEADQRDEYLDAVSERLLKLNRPGTMISDNAERTRNLNTAAAAATDSRALNIYQIDHAIKTYRAIHQSLTVKLGREFGKQLIDSDTVNKQATLAALAKVINKALGIASPTNCKSSKDRTGHVLSVADGLFAALKLHGRFPSYIYETPGAGLQQPKDRQATIIRHAGEPPAEQERTTGIEADATAEYKKQFAATYAKQTKRANDMLTGAAGLKNSDSAEGSNRFMTTALGAVIPVLPIIRAVRTTMVDWVGRSFVEHVSPLAAKTRQREAVRQRKTAAAQAVAQPQAQAQVAAPAQAQRPSRWKVTAGSFFRGLGAAITAPLAVVGSTLANWGKSIKRMFKPIDYRQTPKHDRAAINADLAKGNAANDDDTSKILDTLGHNTEDDSPPVTFKNLKKVAKLNKNFKKKSKLQKFFQNKWVKRIGGACAGLLVVAGGLAAIPFTGPVGAGIAAAGVAMTSSALAIGVTATVATVVGVATFSGIAGMAADMIEERELREETERMTRADHTNRPAAMEEPSRNAETRTPEATGDAAEPIPSPQRTTDPAITDSLEQKQQDEEEADLAARSDDEASHSTRLTSSRRPSAESIIAVGLTGPGAREASAKEKAKPKKQEQKEEQPTRQPRSGTR